MDIEERTTLADFKRGHENLRPSIVTAQGALNKIHQAAVAAKDETAQVLTEEAAASFAEAGRLIDAVLEECGRLRGLGVQIADEPSPQLKAAGMQGQIKQEHSAKLSQIAEQALNQLLTQRLPRSFELVRHLAIPLRPNNRTSVTAELAKEVSGPGFSVNQLVALPGVEFERLIVRLLERMGFHAEMTRATGDGGVDVVATLDQPITGGRYLIQCKRYAPDSTVGAATVREFWGALAADRRAIKGILITTSSFTAQAAEFARELPIELMARDKLQGLLEQHGLLHVVTPAVHPVAQFTSSLDSVLDSIGTLYPALVQALSLWKEFVQALPPFLRPSPPGAEPPH